jgi:hypothetical protein
MMPIDTTIMMAIMTTPDRRTFTKEERWQSE